MLSAAVDPEFSCRITVSIQPCQQNYARIGCPCTGHAHTASKTCRTVVIRVRFPAGELFWLFWRMQHRRESYFASAATPLGTFDVSIMHDRLFSAFSTRFSYICGLSTLALHVCSRAALFVSCLRGQRRFRGRNQSLGFGIGTNPIELCQPLTQRRAAPPPRRSAARRGLGEVATWWRNFYSRSAPSGSAPSGPHATCCASSARLGRVPAPS